MDVVTASSIEKEQDLKSWLEHLNCDTGKCDERENIRESNESKTNSRFEFDTILGELDDLEKQFDAENNSTNILTQTEGAIKPPANANSPNARSPDVSRALEEFSLINSQLEDVLNDLAGFVTEPPEPVKSPSVARVKPPPPPVPSKSHVQALKTQQSFEGDAKILQVMSPPVQTAPQVTGNGLLTDRRLILPDHKPIEKKQEMGKSDSPPVIQSCVSVQLVDETMVGLCVTNKTRVRDLHDSILNDSIKCSQKHFTLWEVLPDLSMERELEPEQLVLSDVVDHWNKNSNNKIIIKFAKMPAIPSPQLKGELKGTLHVKSEEKKSWKSFVFLMQSSGLFFYPKGKGKSDPTCYLDLHQQTGLEVFSGIGWKKKLKAPSEFGFAVKPLKVQVESEKEIKYFCADNEALREIWTSAIRELVRVRHQFPTEEVLNPVKTEPPSTYNDDISHYSEPFETQHRLHSRRISNASSCSGRIDFEESTISPSAKKFANLPITTGTTRFLHSMQATVPQRPPTKTPTIEDYGRSLQKDQLLIDKNQRNQPCLNEYTPSPFACKTPELMPKSQPKTNAIKTLPKPNKALCQQGMTPHLPSDLDLPPPPPSLMTQNIQYQTLPATSKSRTLPPPPPKRDQSTKLSSKPFDTHVTSIQTRNFILNLDRTIGQKKVFGAEGLGRVEMPLPPPPVVSDETSYIDLGELPPPPAELLLGLKRMRVDPGLFQSIRRWP